MPPEHPGVTETELSLLDELWKSGPLPIRSLAEAVYGDSAPSSYATVQSLLERLEKKGFVLRERSGRAHQFSATVRREEFIGRELEALAEKVCEGSLTPILVSLAERAKLSNDERAALLRLIDEQAPAEESEGGAA